MLLRHEANQRHLAFHAPNGLEALKSEVPLGLGLGFGRAHCWSLLGGWLGGQMKLAWGIVDAGRDEWEQGKGAWVGCNVRRLIAWLGGRGGLGLGCHLRGG